ncbi:MAG TPA: glycosyltransferase family 4 protein [Gemmatimonadaceae bacterium]|nr:glycosyltransferase family 4 protein [Gemmatimonadaceae bacterium]
MSSHPVMRSDGKESTGRRDVAPPRVCIVAESFVPVVGGMERQLSALAEGLAARGARTTVVTLRNRPGLAEQEQLGGATVYRIAPSANRWTSLAAVLRELYRLRHEHDVILVGGFRTLGLPAVVHARRYGKHVVLRAECNGELSGAFFDPGLARIRLTHRAAPLVPLNAARKALLARADRFIALAQSMREEFLREGVPASRIVVIPNGVDIQRFHPATPEERYSLRVRLGLPVHARIVCFAGRLVSRKGALTLLQAWRSMDRALAPSESAPVPAARLLLFLGGGGSGQDNCEAEARRLCVESDLTHSVRFLGDVTNVEEYLRAADVFALPTSNDAFAIAVTEAMASGLPVVTTRVAGLADYVVPDSNALAVAPDDEPALHAALVRLLGDAALRARLGVEARRTAERFAQDGVIDRHLELFRELAAHAASMRPPPTRDVGPMAPADFRSA